jgi:hypothetical protein
LSFVKDELSSFELAVSQGHVRRKHFISKTDGRHISATID